MLVTGRIPLKHVKSLDEINPQIDFFVKKQKFHAKISDSGRF